MAIKMQTLLLTPSDENIKKAAEIIKNGGLVGMPTETVYGLAGNALDGSVVKKIYAAKGRPSDNPLIVHIADFDSWKNLVVSVPEKAMKAAEAFWPGPLTVILKKSSLIPPETSGGLDTVAVRMPSHPAARKLIKECGLPLAAPSANSSGKPSPTKASHVMADLEGKIDAVLDGGDCDIGVESTVVSFVGEKAVILRPGGVTPAMLEKVLGEKPVIDKACFAEVDNKARVSSPGMKYKHYSPDANVIILKGSIEKFVSYVESHLQSDEAVICFNGEENLFSCPCFPYGDENDDLSQAKNLFSVLRLVDSRGFKTVYARYPRTEGVGLAVYNRLIRAAGFEVKDL